MRSGGRPFHAIKRKSKGNRGIKSFGFRIASMEPACSSGGEPVRPPSSWTQAHKIQSSQDEHFDPRKYSCSSQSSLLGFFFLLLFFFPSPSTRPSSTRAAVGLVHVHVPAHSRLALSVAVLFLFFVPIPDVQAGL